MKKDIKMKSIHLLVIDPQNDFCSPTGSLYVTGADKDMDRLASMVHRLSPKLEDIHVTLDSHRKIDISHPIWWKDSSGAHPAPFTIIKKDDLKNGIWATTKPGMYARTLAYLEQLEATQRYPHCIWPEHCIIGDEGHNIWPALATAIHEWEDRFAVPDFITKGSNPWTEHFSGVRAEVPDPEDPSTHINTGLIQTLEEADIILLAGEALSHCLANTVRDIAANFSDSRYIEKMVLLTDASSSVTGFEQYGIDFVNEMTAKGMQISTTVDSLA
jgi:nicotinamidase-related amidase